MFAFSVQSGKKDQYHSNRNKEERVKSDDSIVFVSLKQDPDVIRALRSNPSNNGAPDGYLFLRLVPRRPPPTQGKMW